MMPAWSAQYLNLPFLERGRSRQGIDCYGLVRLVYQEQRGIELPTYTESYATTQDRDEIAALCRGEVARQWQEIPTKEAQLFDGVIFRIMGQASHFGMVLEAPYFLHAMREIWSTIERWDSLLWQKRFVTVVRYVG